MIWEVEKSRRSSYLVGTAHFFPYSFKHSLSRLIETARIVLFEGPLDNASLAQVREAGYHGGGSTHLFDLLDRKTTDSFSEVLFPINRYRKANFIDPHSSKKELPAYALIEGMKPWWAFFTIWTYYLEKKGWQYSVDHEGYSITKEMAKPMLFLETIQEQIEVLENLSSERIMAFLKYVDHWDAYTKKYIRCYLNGDVKRLKSIGPGFPSRYQPVLDRRDRILFERMLVHVEGGDAVAFIGAPHIPGICSMFRREGYQIKGPPVE